MNTRRLPPDASQTPLKSKAATRTIFAGRCLTGLFAAFMLIASIAPKFLQAAPATDALVAVGWPPQYALLIGAIELACLVLHLIPRTAVLGAVLMTGLLGAAVAAQLRVGSPVGTHVLFGMYLGIAMWSGLCMRDAEVRRGLFRIP